MRVAFQVGDQLVDAVQGVSLDLAPGEILSIVGESGSGKSTVVNAIQGLLSPNAKIQGGSVRFDGRDMLRLNESQWREVRGKDIGFIPQDPAGSLNPVRKVGIQVAEPLLIHHLADRKSATSKAVELLTMSRLTHPEERANQYPFQFSGGMKQRSLIAGALSTSPKLIIADEPTSALDVTVQKQILDYIEQLVQELGVAVLMITHDLGLAAERSDKVVVMRKGEVVDAGPAREVMSNPSASYTRTLTAVDHANLIDRFPDELSGGQRQRVAIARALALEPEFVVLDEAVSPLDVSVQAQILKLLDELQGELGLSYLFITHDLGVVAESVDTVAVIQHGKMLEYGPTAEIFRHPQSDYTRKLLDAVPSL
ncbi:ATP-binding cassette domain-containing protein [Gulosibacter sediminis]|uniref:ATP-binding cassette domain-containing protein n=1 Tax=Gulosibacter sediminis TaxID=1729695 RepID=UPI0024A858FF|nr:ABC transporter ATP-binding protein [Gulosibacter sediminis]